MALADIYRAYVNKDDSFRQQVAGACLVAAYDIINESPATVGHTQRLAWASAVRANPEGKAIEMMPGVLDNATIKAAMPSPLDNDVQFVVDSLVNTAAGV